MNKKLLSIGIILVFLVVGFSGCLDDISSPFKDEDHSRFVGNWELIEGVGKHATILVFFSDGTGLLQSFNMKWKIQDSDLLIEIPESPLSFMFEYDFFEEDTILKLYAIGDTTPETFQKIS